MECKICFTTLDNNVWKCNQCQACIHQTCYECWNGSCPFCRYENTENQCLSCVCIILILGAFLKYN